MTLHRVVNYDSWKVHYATARREDIAAMLPPEDVTPESWYHWRTLCGRDLIGHKVSDEENENVNWCAACLRSFERARKTYADLAARFGA